MFYFSEVLVSFFEHLNAILLVKSCVSRNEQGDILGLFTLKMKKEGGEER